MYRSIIIFIMLGCAFPLYGQNSPQEICYFFLVDVSKSAAKWVARPDTSELGKLLRYHAEDRPVRLAGLYIQSRSDQQTLQVGPSHYLPAKKITGNYIQKSRARNQQLEEQIALNNNISEDLLGADIYFDRSCDEEYTDITSALQYFERYASQSSNADVRFRLVVVSDMIQDREDGLAFTPLQLPKNVSVWVIGSPLGMDYDHLFPGNQCEELVAFKSEYFIAK